MPATRVLCPVCHCEMEVYTHAVPYLSVGSGDEKRFMEIMADIRMAHLEEAPSCRKHEDWARGYILERVKEPCCGEYHTVWVRLANGTTRLGIYVYEPPGGMHWVDPVTWQPLPAMVTKRWLLDL